MLLSILAKLKVQAVSNGEMVSLGSLWQDSPAVITFLRRFGWVYCRLGARQISELRPTLDAHGVRLIGIGLEDVGVQEFVDEKFFDGDLFIDQAKACYEAMNMKRHGFFSILPSLFSGTARSGLSQAKESGISGNLRGDGFLMGGTIVVDKGGEKLLLEFKQDGPANHVQNSAILTALGINPHEGNNDK